MGDHGWDPLGFFALRTPLLPFDELLALTEPFDDGDGASAPSPRAVRARMLALARRPEVREAIFVASPGLEERLSPALDDPDGELSEGLERPVLAYLIRMASRPTPFGLFSAVATGRTADHTMLDTGRELRRRTRLDMDYLVAAADRLAAEPQTRGVLTWRPNSSLYSSAGRHRMVETRRHDGARSHHLVALEPDDALLAVLAAAEQGSSLDALASALVDGEIDRDTATAYLHDLADAQVLVTDLAPAVTGPEPLPGLVAELQRVGPHAPAAAHAARMLQCAGTALAALDAAGLGAAPSSYRDIAAELATVVPEADVSRLFQVDLFRNGPVPMLGTNVVAEVVKAVELLARIGLPTEDRFASFREAFAQRYEGAEVPLLEVLDEESGIGFEASDHPVAEESPLLVGLSLGTRAPESRWSARDDVVLRLLAGALRTGAVDLELDETAVAELEAAAVPVRTAGDVLPPTLSVMGRLAAASAAEVDDGRFRLFVYGARGASGAQLLGRFCHGDRVLESGVRQMLRSEEASRPAAVFAEIVHLPEGRIGNILCRPVLREHEIPYLGRSGAPASAQIPAADLLVSVVEGRVVVSSRRLGREVVPRLTSAHNTRHGAVGVYRFLAALQYHRQRRLHWDWGVLGGAPFLPRVTHGRLVLSRAQWSARGLRTATDLERLRREVRLPRRVALRDGDNELTLDLDDPYMVSTALDLVREREAVTFVEMFPSADELCATGPGGRYVHELIVPLVRRQPSPGPTPSGPVPARVHGARRRFAPGSEWLYVKLYTGTGTADSVLRSPVAELVREALASGAADRWFFVRYADPDHHLRLRLHGDARRLREEIQPVLAAAAERLMAEGRVWRVGFDTYHRELERFGGAAGIDACEAIFSADSDAVVRIVERLSGDAGLDARWQLCLVGIDRLLGDAGLAVAARRDWARVQAGRFAAELAADPALTRQLGRTWRRFGRDLQQLVASNGSSDHPLAPGLTLLEGRSESIAPHLDGLRRAAAAGDLTASLDELLASLAHMHANRLLRSAQRAQEMVLYELLARVYTAQLARGGG